LIVLKDKKDAVKKLYEDNWYYDAFIKLNPGFECDE